MNDRVIKLENIFPRLLKDTYVIHSTGGYHPFKDVLEAESIFKEDAWPYIQRIHWLNQPNDPANEWKKNNRAKQLNMQMSFMHCYPYTSLMGEEKVLKHPKNKPSHWGYQSVFMKMHVAVARAFIPNIHNKSQVCHINDDPANYRISNLKWGTNRENHTGRRGDRAMSFNTLHTIFKINGWAKG